MTEILTESFCERCGTRYTFESAAPRTARLKGIRVLSRGFKNFVMSDDTSMDEAMAAARSETDREATSQQLDAFHKTFNFCMSCRQYTCANCWNEADGRCLTCAPHLGHEILAAPFPDLDAKGGVALADGANGADGTNGHVPADPTDTLAWPTMDLDRDMPGSADEAAPYDIEPIDAAARLAALGATAPPAFEADDTAEPVSQVAEPVSQVAEPVSQVAEPVTDVDSAAAATQPETESASGQQPEPTADNEGLVAAETVFQGPQAQGSAGLDPADILGRSAAATAQTTSLLRRFRPGQNLDAEIDAFEREQAAVPATPAAFEVTPRIDPAPAQDVVSDAVPDATVEAPPRATEALLEPASADDAAKVEPVVAEVEPVVAEIEPVETPPFAEAASADDAPADDAPGAPGPHEDRVEQPTWRIVAPEAPASIAPRTDPTNEPGAARTEPQWPAQPEWPSEGRAAAGLPFLGRPAQPTGTLESLWAESAREVVSAPTPMAQGGAPARATGGVQPCISCGLSLSATARFCRRCGSSQG